MDNTYNFAMQGLGTNADEQSLEQQGGSSGQQWLQMNPQYCIPPQFASPGMSGFQQPSQPALHHFTVGQQVQPSSSAGTKQKKVKLPNFNVDEDVNLIKWWLAVSTDPVVNTGQRAGGFWYRTTKGYNSTRAAQHEERTQKSLNGRWDQIKPRCTVFADFYTVVLRENPSGMSDADKTTEALARYAAVHKPFMFMHCWKYLKDEPKWQDLVAGQAKTSEADDDCYVPADSDKPDNEVDNSNPSSGSNKRPLGRDAAKQKKKKTASASAAS